MTLLLAPFWTFGKEKSKDQAETEKDEWIVPELPICYFLSATDLRFISRPCETWSDTSSEELIILPLNNEDSFYLSDELQQKNDFVDDDEFINHLNQLGILNRLDIEGNQVCGTRH